VSFAKTTDPVTKKVAGTPDGQFLAFAIIDPGAAVYDYTQNPIVNGVGPPASPPTDGGTTGLGLQHWGWYGQYLVSYLNGGYIPMSGDNIVPQNLYYPTYTYTDGGEGALSGAIGQGLDVLDAVPGQAAYSPVCQVLTFNAGAVANEGALPTSASTIASSFASSITPGTPPFIFCLQLQ
jgi:hypothetical protein